MRTAPGTLLEYNRLTVLQHPALRFRPASNSPLSNSKEISVKKLFVGNLDFGATEESSRSLFAPYWGNF